MTVIINVAFIAFILHKRVVERVYEGVPECKNLEGYYEWDTTQ